MGRWNASLALAAAVAVGITGCGSDDETPAATNAGTSGGGGGSAVVEQAKQNVATAMEPQKAEVAGEPFTPPASKRIGAVSILASAPGPGAIDDGIKEASKVLGWKVTILDGKQTPKGYADGDRLLAQQKVDGVIHTVIGDSASPTSLAAVRDAGIDVVCVYCANALQKPVAKPSTGNVDPDFKGQGAILADWVIADSDGKGKIAIQDNNAVPAVKARYDGFMERIKECDGCEVIDDQKVSPGADVLGNGRRTASSLLQRFPEGEIDYIITASDGEAVGPGQIIRSTGRSDVKVASYDCDDLNLDWVRSGGPQGACVASPLTWGGWAAVNALALLLSGEKPDDYKLPSQLVTQENAPPKGTKPFADVDFRSAYTQLWGK